MVKFERVPPADILSDAEISRLINEPKPLPYGLVNPILVVVNGHRRADFDVNGVDGGQYQVHIRISEEDSFEFSVVLSYKMQRTGAWINLRRYNGFHEHRNALEKGPLFMDYHIHEATERYQRAAGRKPEAYAEPTSRYVDVHGAIECLIDDCGFFSEPVAQWTLEL